jgi:hypothetical protein
LDNGGGLAVSVLGTDVEVVEWYAKLADFVSSGSITAAVRTGLEAALGAVTGGGFGLLDTEVLTRIVAAGTSGAARVSAQARQVWIEPGVIVLGGDFSRSPEPPVPNPIALADRIDGSLTRTPGANPAQVLWTVDGVDHMVAFERRALSFTAPTGWSRVSLTVTTDEGQTATTEVTRP